VITVKHLDHISMAAPSWRKQSELLHRLLGFKFLHGFGEASTTGFGGCVTQVPGTDIEFEIMDPVGDNSFIQRFLDEQGPGLHHITIEVPDINETIAELQRLGIKPFGGLQNDGMWNLTYIHPKDSGGILWQLFTPHKSPPEVDRTTTGGAVGLKRVDHVSMAVPDLERQVEWQEHVFGMVPGGRWRDDQLGYDGCVLTIPNSQLEFEIIAPSRPDSFVQKFIDTRRAGMHHICCEVESVEASAEALKREGIEPFGGILGGDGDWHKQTFIHPRDSGGVLFQLFGE
jgi:methylmalonyl-CoA/ethylmalonyl-CoA epimerase